MFKNLTEKLESAFKNLKGQARITDLNIANTVKDIRRALIDADVNFKIAKEFTAKHLSGDTLQAYLMVSISIC